jgi:D-beta-D-heptose 7-phosphate kinase/D-beta-D-heptose 1-phosphate adenosyltransferase
MAGSPRFWPFEKLVLKTEESNPNAYGHFAQEGRHCRVAQTSGLHESHRGLGLFDFIHPGHVKLLQSARELGDTLILGINSDASIRHLKGPKRPIYPEAERILMLGSLRWVDAITVFDDYKATNFLKAAQPDIWVKGNDWTLDKIDKEELAAVESNGGKLQFVDTGVSWHTTSILETLAKL